MGRNVKPVRSSASIRARSPSLSLRAGDIDNIAGMLNAIVRLVGALLPEQRDEWQT